MRSGTALSVGNPDFGIVQNTQSLTEDTEEIEKKIDLKSKNQHALWPVLIKIETSVVSDVHEN